MLELNLVLVGLVVGLLIAMTMLGQPRVIVPPIERSAGVDGGGGGCGLLAGLFVILAVALVLDGAVQVRLP